MNITFRYACLCKAALITSLLFVALAITLMAETPDYDNSLFIRPDRPFFLGRELTYEWTSIERARHLIVP